ncbi:MAG TPA: Eco57I restriction-modification methylase domain-containing protein [Anaerolineaceae bacterium]|nr:Eco57I restriction-modification methylase domain-containing protein [Anaerolineaceae bacterium]
MTTSQQVYDLLQRMSREGLAAAKRLFWTELNYDQANVPLSTREWPETVQRLLAEEPPLLLAQHKTGSGTFHIIYIRLAEVQHGRGFPLSLVAERLVVKQLLQNHPHSLFVFSDRAARHWHLVNVKFERRQLAAGEGWVSQPILRRIAIGPEERLRTAAERIAQLDLASLSPNLFGLDALAIQHEHDQAFDVETVTNQFFGGYKRVFAALQTELRQQTGDAQWAHDYALQFLNRLMFLYYVQRKRWLGNDPEFLATFWSAYRQAQRPPDTFVGEWLSVLFFEAFNKHFQAGRADYQYFPITIREALASAPYLNGGLFLSNELDRTYQPVIADASFGQIFEFLEHYNFTISEDTPLDQEVAVDPEMIGKVYESLVNVSDNIDERGEAGIFYTPRVEIDLMCRLALVNWLTNLLGAELKPLLYEAIFAFDPEEKTHADTALAERNLWPQLNNLLRNVTALDPACGSGSFLVGMLYVLDDLLARAAFQLGIEETPYERKKRIIGQSLYGVDVMDWAVHVAELRLWLQLVIDTDLEPAELLFRPLLPNLSFKVRQGDSLVQEIGGINLALRRGSRLIPPAIKGRITQLKGEKLKFYQNEPQRKYQTAQQLHLEELRLFRDLLEERTQALDTRRRELEQALAPQENLFGEVQARQLGLDRMALEEELTTLQIERAHAVEACEALRTVKDVPFVWDIAFVEIFSGDRPGFDLIMGNPPYVRQELIRDPRRPAEATTANDKRAYKEKLAHAVYTAWPQTFGYDWNSGKARWKLDAKSDLYIYFYLYGLSLLSEQGVFCFITSNSWLDVGYGKDLQEFLLTRGEVRLVIDNQARRSFASADVNTVIVVLGAAQDSRRERAEVLRHMARFVLFKTPFEQTLTASVWQAIETARERQATEAYRVFPLTQGDLLKQGMDPEKKEFAGDKWGGKYLRAPDIFWVILERCKDKLVRLGDIAEVRFGIKTGANEFFYLNQESIRQWGIESQYLRSVIRTPRECKSIYVEPENLSHKILICHQDKKDLVGTNVLEYILWGEDQGFDQRPSCRGRTRWYSLEHQSQADFIMLRFRDLRNWTPLIPSDEFLVGDTVFVGTFLNRRFVEIGGAILNSTFQVLVSEIYGRVNLGDGLLTTYGPEITVFPMLNPEAAQKHASELVQCLERITKRDVLSVFSEIEQDDRRELDSIIFDILGLTTQERVAVYAAVHTLVKKRVGKAQSLKSRQGEFFKEES